MSSASVPTTRCSQHTGLGSSSDPGVHRSAVSRSRTIASGDTQAAFVVVEDNMVVPRTGDELSIWVGLDPTGRGGEAPRKRKRG